MIGKPIMIRPTAEGQIPGLIECNSFLAERFGVVVAAVIDGKDDPSALAAQWVGAEVRPARINRQTDSIDVAHNVLAGKSHVITPEQFEEVCRAVPGWGVLRDSENAVRLTRTFNGATVEKTFTGPPYVPFAQMLATIRQRIAITERMYGAGPGGA